MATPPPGGWAHGVVDATPARLHIVRLRSAGALVKGIVADTSLCSYTVHAIIRGQPRCLAETRNRILAVPLPTRPQPPTGRCDMHGTLRRVRGLARDGWPFRTISARTGVSLAVITRLHRLTHVSLSLMEKIRAFADELDGARGPSLISEQKAANRGWHTLDAWADIDDPDCVPFAGCDRHRPSQDEAVVLAMLTGQGPARPPACQQHSRHSRPSTCDVCANRQAWSRCRDEAVRRGTLHPPLGPGLSAQQLAARLRCPRRAVQRARARQRAAAAS